MLPRSDVRGRRPAAVHVRTDQKVETGIVGTKTSTNHEPPAHHKHSLQLRLPTPSLALAHEALVAGAL